MSFPGTSSRSKVVREMAAEARAAAMEGRWEDAVDLNLKLIERSPRDVDARNRLGKAHYELGRFRAAYEAYSDALEADPASIIARRNIERLEPLRDIEDEPSDLDDASHSKRYGAFVQEAGKTYVDDLVNQGPASLLRRVAAGDRLDIARDEGKVVFIDREGNYVGAPEPRLARRLDWLLEQGNTYDVYVTANAGDHVRVIVREATRSDEIGEEMSFPEQVNRAIPRAYVRDSRLFRADEHDLIIPPDDDEDLEDLADEEEEGVSVEDLDDDYDADDDQEEPEEEED